MTERGRGGWGHHRHGPGFRPPWWPDNEPFPPEGREAWRGMKRGFARRAVLFVVMLFGCVVLVSSFVHIVLSGAFGVDPPEGIAAPAVILGLLILLVVMALVIRAVRRMARPIGDVMEA